MTSSASEVQAAPDGTGLRRREILFPVLNMRLPEVFRDQVLDRPELELEAEVA